jgi:hypothetical protein
MSNVTGIYLVRLSARRRGISLSKARREQVRENLLNCRVRRPALEALILDGGFLNLPVVNQAEFRSAMMLPTAARTAWLAEHAWHMPRTDLGRLQNKPVDSSTVEAVRLWIANRLLDSSGPLLDRDEFALTHVG